MNLFSQIIKGALLSFFVIIAINFTATLTSKNRLILVASEANNKHQLEQYSEPDNDMFTECALIYMGIARDENIFSDIFISKEELQDQHPCDKVRDLLDSNNSHTSYVAKENTRYFYGARYLFSILANAFSLDQIRSIYFNLSILAPLLLWGAFLLRDRSNFVSISPLIISMLIGFDLSVMGGNTAHSPGFFIPTLCLSGVVFWRDRLIDLKKRVFIYTLIASVTAYLDILTGPLPFVLLLTIITNHLLYHPLKSKMLENLQWAIEAAGLFVLFLSAYALLITIKMLAAYVLTDHNVFLEFYNALSFRLSSTVNGIDAISHTQVWKELWAFRGINFNHSIISATMYYGFASAAWLLVLIVLTYHFAFRIILPYWREIAVLIFISSGVFFWYYIFVNHTYIHARFMGRLGIVPASSGAMALIFLARSHCKKNFYRIAWLCGIIMAPLAAVLLIIFPAMFISELSPDHAVKVDMVSCSNSPLIKKDGIIDKALKFKVENIPIIFNITISNIRLERINPSGIYSSNKGSYPISLLDGKLNSTFDDRSERFSGHFNGNGKDNIVVYCSDGLDTAKSKYRLLIETNVGSLYTNYVSIGSEL